MKCAFLSLVLTAVLAHCSDVTIFYNIESIYTIWNLLLDVCGQQFGLSTRIINGKNAQKWPWLGAIFLYKRSTTIVFCGTALINELYTLTAAHCLFFPNRTTRFDPSEFKVRLGEYDTKKYDDGAEDFAVAQTYPHKWFTPKDGANDIGILKLQRPVTFSNTISPICLPDTPDLIYSNYTNGKPYVAGWGRTTIEGGQKAILQEIQLHVSDHDKCKQIYVDAANITDSRFCALHPSNGNVCQGDSGGPVMMQNSNKQFAVIGVVSLGQSCGSGVIPTIHTRVASYLGWIKKYTRIS